MVVREREREGLYILSDNVYPINILDWYIICLLAEESDPLWHDCYFWLWDCLLRFCKKLIDFLFSFLYCERIKVKSYNMNIPCGELNWEANLLGFCVDLKPSGFRDSQIGWSSWNISRQFSQNKNKNYELNTVFPDNHPSLCLLTN